MRRKRRRIAGWSVLGAALLVLVCGVIGIAPFGDQASGPQSLESGALDGLSLLPGLGESIVNFGSPLEDQVAEAPPFVDALDADSGRSGHLAWAGLGATMGAQLPSVALPGGIEPDAGDGGGPPLSDAPFAAFGGTDDALASLSDGSLGSFVGAGGGSSLPGSLLPGSSLGDEGGNPNGPPNGDPVPEPSPVDLLQIALALLAGLFYRRFRA